MSENLEQRALRYHAAAPAGKLSVNPIKPMATQDDLSLAYSPGVAAPCLEIQADPAKVFEYTGRGNLVAVVSNGTAVLGLGNIGALASKPVMEGKVALFKKFSGINGYDIEIDETDPKRFCDIVAGLEATFGGINLEDIKAPECFAIEAELRRRMKIPVFHDDQHGTAIVAVAAIVGALKVVDKRLDSVKLVALGAGAAGIATLDLLVRMGLPKAQIVLLDTRGVIHPGRNETLEPNKARYARQTEMRTLDDAIVGADVFLGVSGPNLLGVEHCKKMADRPLILALANPTPEIDPSLVRRARPDAMVCTGRSDYPNQVNNVLCFPFLFRGALDVGATEVNEAMKIACVNALSEVAQQEPSDIVKQAYASESLTFGPDYLLPKPFDPRLVTDVAPAVARAAMDSGVATRPIEDFPAYRRKLSRLVYQSSDVMEPLFLRAQHDPMRLVYVDGEDERVLQATQQIVNREIARPILLGREEYIIGRMTAMGLRVEPGRDFDIINPQDSSRNLDFAELYLELMGRKGVAMARADRVLRNRRTAFGALLVRTGEADAMICGTSTPFSRQFVHVRDVIDKAEGVEKLSTMVVLILDQGTFFICDTHVSVKPKVRELVAMTLLAAKEVRRFGMEPKIALLSHSNFGTYEDKESRRMRKAAAILRDEYPEIEVDGEMHAETALSAAMRNRLLPDGKLKGMANLLIMPNIDAAHIAYTMLKMLGQGVTVGPILLGAAKPVHIATQTITVRGLVNLSAYAVVQAQEMRQQAEQTEQTAAR